MRKTLLLILLSACCAAQAKVHFNHIVIIIQENRSPDNLFGDTAKCPIAGSDIQPQGIVTPLAHSYDVGHSYSDARSELAGHWPNRTFAYVRGADVQPYCQIATQYGFGDRFFQTNQGASFVAHQFLVSGTSAPSDDSDLFVSGNPPHSKSNCAVQGVDVPTIKPDGSAGPSVFPCFKRSNLMDLLTSYGFTWTYYSQQSSSIWDAPMALKTTYTSTSNRHTDSLLNDINNGNLANVTWVTPPGICSDHPGATGQGCGPAFVAGVVNAIGQSQFWKDTAIFVTWDDWGGWWDHVTPPPSSWAPQMTYNFRVPLLVISTYTPANYNSYVTMDFGSLLLFVEQNFNLPFIGSGTFADRYAQFDSGYFNGKARTFQPIPHPDLKTPQLTDTSDLDD